MIAEEVKDWINKHSINIELSKEKCEFICRDICKYVFAQREKEREASHNKYEKRKQLLAEARDGNEDAIESLTIEDMDTYNRLSLRIMQEDILSIVNSTFMPYGFESDQYHILGEIIELEEIENVLTGELLYFMKLECNDMIFFVTINQKDLLGVPSVGRRFKGSIWMQGMVCL